MKTTSSTERKRYAFEKASQCGARTKSNNGKHCRCPAMKGKKRCRLHGGAKGSGAKQGNSNALKHGNSTKEQKQLRRQIKKAVKTTKLIIDATNKLS